MDHFCEWQRAVAGVWRCFPVAADVQIKEELQRLGSECTRAHSTNARLIQQAWSMPGFSGLCLCVSKLGVKSESVAAQAITDAARDGVHLAEGQGVRSQGRQVTRFIPMRLCPCRAFREPIRDCARRNPFAHCTFFRTVALVRRYTDVREESGDRRDGGASISQAAHDTIDPAGCAVKIPTSNTLRNRHSASAVWRAAHVFVLVS